MGRKRRRQQAREAVRQGEKQKSRSTKGLERFHDQHYKNLLFIPMIFGILSIIAIASLYVSTGDFIHRGISLKGGTSYTFTTNQFVEPALFEDELSLAFPDEDFAVRELERNGEITALVIESSMQQENDQLLGMVGQKLGHDIQTSEYTVEEIGSALGESFFSDLIKTLIFAFILMGSVVFYYFRSFVPSMAVISAAALDILITVAIINIFGIRLSTAGIAAFLMLLGYSIDTDILLTTRILKRPGGETIFGATIDAMKTGLTMSAAGISATTLAFLLSTSPVIKQIMLILMIGLIVDVMTTWLQNASLLRWYLERKS